MSTPQQDLTVGASIAVDVLEQIQHATNKLPDRPAQVRMWLGVFCGLAGAAGESIGATDTRLAMLAAINALPKGIPE